MNFLRRAHKIFTNFSRLSEKQLCFVPRLQMASEESVQVSMEVYNELRESAEQKTLMIDDLLEKAEEYLLKDQQAETSRNELEKQRRDELRQLQEAAASKEREEQARRNEE